MDIKKLLRVLSYVLVALLTASLTLGGVAFFEHDAVVPNAIPGLSASSSEATKVTFTLSPEYFASLHGAVQDLQFAMTDTEGEYFVGGVGTLFGVDP